MVFLQNKFIKFRTRAFLKKKHQKRASVGFLEAKTIGIIFSIEDKKKHEEVKHFIHVLTREGKQVEVMAYLGRDKENYEFIFNFFTEKDFTLTGDISNQELIKFADKPFDYLFNLDYEPNLQIRNVLARSHAKCRIGNFSGEDSNKFFEMMISMNQDGKEIRDLFKEIYHYTKSVRNERTI